MNLSELCEIGKKYKAILLCGYNATAELLCQSLKNELPAIPIIPVDNSQLKQKKNGGVALSPEEAVRMYPEGLYLIVPPGCRKDLREQLMHLGIPEEHILLDMPEEILEATGNELAARNLRPQPVDTFHFEVNIVRHCNLKCKGCNHFSPLAEQKYEDPREYDRHFARLAELFQGNVRQVLLLGGEPLLHPEIAEFMRLARKHFPNTELSVMTNGLLLQQKGTLFMDQCREYDTTVTVTRYPIALDYAKLESFVTDHGVRFSMVGGTENDGRTLWYEPKDVNGSKDGVVEFKQCLQANRCYTLEGSRLYLTFPRISD